MSAILEGAENRFIEKSDCGGSLKTALTLFILFVMLTTCLGQSNSAKWQVATVMDIKANPPAAGEPVRYYVKVRVENTEYVVLYVPADATLKDVVEYHPGMDGLVLVGAENIKYNDMLGRTREVRIISHRAISAKIPEKKPDKKD